MAHGVTAQAFAPEIKWQLEIRTWLSVAGAVSVILDPQSPQCRLFP